MSFLGLIPLFVGLGAALLNKAKSKKTTDLSTPNYASTEVLLSQEEIRRKAQNRKGRRSTNITGGLTGMPTLGGGALWPI
jgi:hypothetical protein